MNYKEFENYVVYLPLIEKYTNEHRRENKQLKKEIDNYILKLKKLKSAHKNLSNENKLLKDKIYKMTIELNKTLKSTWKIIGVENIDKLSKLPPRNFHGWTVQYRAPYFKLYKKINRKTISIHIGRYWYDNKVLEKIAQKNKAIGLDES